jgi:hypothetical protein
LNANDGLHGDFGAGDADSMRGQIDGFQVPEITLHRDILLTGRMTLGGDNQNKEIVINM